VVQVAAYVPVDPGVSNSAKPPRVQAVQPDPAVIVPPRAFPRRRVPGSVVVTLPLVREVLPLAGPLVEYPSSVFCAPLNSNIRTEALDWDALRVAVTMSAPPDGLVAHQAASVRPLACMGVPTDVQVFPSVSATLLTVPEAAAQVTTQISRLPAVTFDAKFLFGVDVVAPLPAISCTFRIAIYGDLATLGTMMYSCTPIVCPSPVVGLSIKQSAIRTM
jgi:hypothetical protein